METTLEHASIVLSSAQQAFDSADATLGAPAPVIENVDQIVVVQKSLPKQPKLNELRPPLDTPSQFGLLISGR